MGISLGLVGLPNVGKSTLFNALTEQGVPAENYPFCTIEPSTGLVPVKDGRLNQLAEVFQSKETIPSIIKVVDIAGLVEGAAAGEGLGNKFLANIREVDAIAHVLRCFPLDTSHKDAINHVKGSVDPKRDMEIINMELCLADLESVNRRLEKIAGDVKRKQKEALREYELLTATQPILEEGKLLLSSQEADTLKEELGHLHLLTLKPVLYVLNMQTGKENYSESHPADYKNLVQEIKALHAEYVEIDAFSHAELVGLDQEEKSMLHEEIKYYGLEHLVQTAYALLGRASFFTVGPEEARAWAYQSGATAPQASAAIHTDFEQKFIRAEVIQWEKLVHATSWQKAREAGEVQLAGKDYVIKEGDVMIVKI